MSTDGEKAEEARHSAAMQIVEDTAIAFRRGAVSFNRAKSIIDDALVGEADRIVRIQTKPYTPEVQG